jgi:hypothetical protein
VSGGGDDVFGTEKGTGGLGRGGMGRDYGGMGFMFVYIYMGVDG